MAKRTKFIMNMDWARLAANLPKETAGELFIAISKFQLGEDYSIDDQMVSAIFAMIQPQMEEDISKWEQTVEKNKKAAGKRWDETPDACECMPNDADACERIPDACECIEKNADASISMPNDADNGFDIGFDIGFGIDDGFEKESEKQNIKTIVEYLNEVVGAHYKPTTPKTVSLIKARLKEGFTVDDFKTVIDKKAAHWARDGDMQKYLRPETLFGTKFEGYLNEHDKPTMREEVDSWV